MEDNTAAGRAGKQPVDAGMPEWEIISLKQTRRLVPGKYHHFDKVCHFDRGYSNLK
jgi:hypothetical protein